MRLLKDLFRRLEMHQSNRHSQNLIADHQMKKKNEQNLKRIMGNKELGKKFE